MSELLEAARAVIAWHERWPKLAPVQCPRMPDGRALACRCDTVCCHERLRLAIATEDSMQHNVEVKGDTK
jgi:hypothetical protein